MDLYDYRQGISSKDKSNIKVGYQGVKGSFSEEAMIEFFGYN